VVLKFKSKREYGSIINCICMVDKFCSMEMSIAESFKMEKEKAMVYSIITMEIIIKAIGQRVFKMDPEDSIHLTAYKNSMAIS